MQEKILALALAVSGGGEEHRALLETLCAAAETAWRARLRDGVTAEDCPDSFCCAVAFTAAADLAAGQGGGISAFTAGVVSVKGCGGAENAARAAALRQTAERLMEPYAEPGGFCVKGVRT